MEEKEEENDETTSIIKHASKPPISEIASSYSNNNQSFTVSPKDLSDLMNLYKDRHDNNNRLYLSSMKISKI